MRTSSLRLAWLGAFALAVLGSGCAVKRIENGAYHSSKGYRVTIPSGEWTEVAEGPADLALRHGASPAAMAVNAVCEGGERRRAAGVLARQLRIGLRDRAVRERGTLDVAGRPASRVVVDGRLEDAKTVVRIETVSMADGRCLYDFLYVAPPEGFDATRGDFTRFVESFRKD